MISLSARHFSNYILSFALKLCPFWIVPSDAQLNWGLTWGRGRRRRGTKGRRGQGSNNRESSSSERISPERRRKRREEAWRCRSEAWQHQRLQVCDLSWILNMHRYTGVDRCCVHRVAKLDIKAADCSLCLQELCLLWSTVCDFARGSLITEWFKALSPKPEGVGERNTLLLSFILTFILALLIITVTIYTGPEMYRKS